MLPFCQLVKTELHCWKVLRNPLSIVQVIIVTILSAAYVYTAMPSPQPKSTILTSLPSAWNYCPVANYLSMALRNSWKTRGRAFSSSPPAGPTATASTSLKDPYTADLGPETYSKIYGMTVADNGDLIGVGGVGYNSGANVWEESHWLFRIGLRTTSSRGFT